MARTSYEGATRRTVHPKTDPRDRAAGTRSDAFYEGTEATFLENGLSQELTSCIVSGVRDLDPTIPGMADFKEIGDVSDELANETADLTEACPASTP